MEESAPIETEVRREADVVRQVRESDSDLVPNHHGTMSANTTSHSSPNLLPCGQDSLEDIPEGDMMVGDTPNGDKVSSTFKQQAMLNSKGKDFWETFDNINSTPPPPAFLPRASSISDDISMDSPSNSTQSSIYTTTSSSQIFNTMAFSTPPTTSYESQQPLTSTAPSYNIPSAAEISRKVNNKRRRNNDDFDDDPANFKRRAVSPGSAMSVHNSPIMQSPMQRDVHPWGSRSAASANANASGNPNSNSTGELNGNVNGTPAKGGMKRVGMQGMADTNDGLMNMSID